MIESNYNSIISNNVYDNCIGIHLISSNNNTKHENKISFNFIPGTRLLNSNNNLISGNIVDSNGLDLLEYYLVSVIKFEKSSNNILLDDIFSNNSVGISLIFYSDNNIISGNDVKNKEYGGINIKDLSNNFASRNIISNNKGYGIYVDDSPDKKIVKKEWKQYIKENMKKNKKNKNLKNLKTFIETEIE